MACCGAAAGAPGAPGAAGAAGGSGHGHGHGPGNAGVGPQIWYRDVAGFLFGGRDQLANFVPERNTPIAEQLNASMRFALYLALLVLLLKRSLLPPLVILVVAGLSTAAVYQGEQSAEGDVRERMGARGS